MSRDISGIKKMKVERVKMEEKQEKELVTEITRQFSVENFVEKVRHHCIPVHFSNLSKS